MILAEIKRVGMPLNHVARRIHRHPSTVSRWFRSSQNWTLGTVSDLALAVACVIDISEEGQICLRRIEDLLTSREVPKLREETE